MKVRYSFLIVASLYWLSVNNIAVAQQHHCEHQSVGRESERLIPEPRPSPVAARDSGQPRSQHSNQLSRVVIGKHELAHDGSSGRDNEHLDPTVVQTMVDAAVMAFTGTDSVVAAWQQIIPDPSKRVAIKVNCQITGIYSKAVVVNAITNGLVTRGVPEDNILIYDKTDNAFSYAGFVRNPNGPGTRVGVLNDNDFGGYSAYPELFEIANMLIGESGGFDCDYLSLSTRSTR